MRSFLGFDDNEWKIEQFDLSNLYNLSISLSLLIV